MASILLVAEDPLQLNALWHILWLDGEHDAERCADAAEALVRLRQQEFDVVIADCRMAAMDGELFCRSVREIQPDTYRMLLSCYSERSQLRGADGAGVVHRILESPCDGLVLLSAIRDGVAHVKVQREIARLRAELDTARRLLDERTRLLAHLALNHPELVPFQAISLYSAVALVERERRKSA